MSAPPNDEVIVILVLRASLEAYRLRSFLACPDVVVLLSFRLGCVPSMEIPESPEARLSRRRLLMAALQLPYLAGPWSPWSVDSPLQRHVHLEIHMDVSRPSLADLPLQVLVDWPLR